MKRVRLNVIPVIAFPVCRYIVPCVLDSLDSRISVRSLGSSRPMVSVDACKIRMAEPGCVKIPRTLRLLVTNLGCLDLR